MGAATSKVVLYLSIEMIVYFVISWFAHNVFEIAFSTFGGKILLGADIAHILFLLGIELILLNHLFGLSNSTKDEKLAWGILLLAFPPLSFISYWLLRIKPEYAKQSGDSIRGDF